MRRRLPDVVRQVAEEAPELVERVVLVGGDVVDRARARLHPSAAELLLVGRLAHAGHRDDRRPGHEQLRRLLDDHREVRADDARGAEPRHRPERRGRDGHGRQVLHDQVEAGQRRHVREAHLLERLDAAAATRAVHEPDERKPQVVCHALGVDGLLPDGGVGRAAADREVVALDDGAAAVDATLADDRVRGEELGELAVLGVGAAPGERTGLVEAARVEEPVDPLANRQPARLMLPADALLAAHAPGELLAPAQLLELGLPGHAPGDPSAAKGVRPVPCSRCLARTPRGRPSRAAPRPSRAAPPRGRAGARGAAASRRGSLGATSRSATQRPHLARDPGEEALELHDAAEGRVAGELAVQLQPAHLLEAPRGDVLELVRAEAEVLA